MPKHKYLLVVFALQFILIGVMFVVAYSPLMFGDEIQTKVEGYDPIQKAQDYERKLRNTGAIATLKVFNGRARIVDLKFLDSP